jgi:hypothetical protein
MALVKYQAQLGRVARPQVHALLGLYAMSIDLLDLAERHLHLSVQAGTQSRELVTFVHLNTAIIRFVVTAEGKLGFETIDCSQ